MHSSKKKLLKIAGASLGIVLVFLFGLGVGNGSVLFSSGSHSASKTLPDNLDYGSIEQLYDILKDNYDGKLDARALEDGLRSGLVSAAGDPYTQYFDPAEAKEFDQELSGSFTGIGAELGQNDSKNLIIASPIKGFPAEKAGLRPQDVIVSINNEPTSDMSINDAVKRIRGAEGTKVDLRILRGNEDLKFTITREKITIPSVEWSITDNIGYLHISQFGPDTTMLATRAADEFRAKNVRGIVLDMRGNPGGLLDSAVHIASLWLPTGKTVLVQKQGGVTVETYTAKGDAPLQGIRTAVLINAGSASASEIVAGALKDNKAATLFGEKSYGKGSVQKIHDLPNGGEVKVTMARWFRPNGQNIDKKGISPDREIKLSEEDYNAKRDPQKDAASAFVKTQ